MLEHNNGINKKTNLSMAFRKDTKIKSNFSKITIGLASPEEILENSYGEVGKGLRMSLW